MLKKAILISLGSMALLFNLPAAATAFQAKGIYLGYGKVNEKVLNSHKQDNEGLALMANLGYQFNPFIATEAGFAWLPDQEYDYGIKANSNFVVDLALKGIIPF